MINLLNRLFQILTTSLPTYLRDAQPWVERDSQDLRETIEQIAEEEASLAVRLARAIQHEGGPLVRGGFPTEFTALHDLSLDYLVRRVIERQQVDIDSIEQCVAGLAPKPHLQALSTEVLREAKQHLKKLKQLTAVDSSSVGS